VLHDPLVLLHAPPISVLSFQFNFSPFQSISTRFISLLHNLHIIALLPLFHLILRLLILLDQVVQDLLQAIRVCLKGRHDVGDGALDEDAVDHAEALAGAGEGVKGFEDESVGEEEGSVNDCKACSDWVRKVLKWKRVVRWRWRWRWR